MKKSYLIIGSILFVITTTILIFLINSNPEEINDSWKSDSIQLMQHETEGYFGCFGCSEAGQEPALCIDPIMEMKPAEETAEKYCNSDFEIVE
jgi:hypothetical protein